MPVDQPSNIYQQLSSHNHGLALWDPKPVENLYKQPGHVSIGDVGYLDNGAFMRMFNVTLPWDDPSNELLGKPGKYEIIEPRYSSNVRDNEIREAVYCTPHVSKVDNVGADRHEDSLGQMYQCRAQHGGALLSLPDKGHRKEVIPKKAFENYIKDNVDNWFRWSKEMMLPVEQMEDLILVTGCTLVTSWAAAAFDGRMSVDSDAMTISLEARKPDGGGTQFFWRNIHGNVEYDNSRFDPNAQEPLPQDQCVFIKGYRAKRTFFRIKPMRAAAEPLPDDPDDYREDETQVTRIPDSSKYRDPLAGVLDYIVEKCREDVSTAEDIIAIAHDDDLQFIEGVETLTADAVENFLREKKVPLLIENGAAILRDQAGDEPPAYDEIKAIPVAAHSPSSSTLGSATLAPGSSNQNDVLFWTSQDPRQSQLFSPWGVVYRFQTETNSQGQGITTVWRAIRADREVRVARLEWGPGGGLGRAVIGKHRLPMADLVRRDSRLSNARIFNGPDGFQYKWRPSTTNQDIVLLDPNNNVIAFVRPTRPTRYQVVGDVHAELHFVRSAGAGVVMHPPLMDTVTVTAMLYRFVSAFNL